MPELPEAETIRRGLAAPLRGRVVRRVRIPRPDLLTQESDRFTSLVEGARFLDVGRRGKNLVFELAAVDENDPHLRMVVNLGMSGGMTLLRADDDSTGPSHPGVVFDLDGEGALIYHDVRRFGRLTAFGSRAFSNWSQALGPEPLDSSFTPSSLADGLSGSRSPIRSWLLDQKRIAGVGNIYANEALFGARIHPRTPANRISADDSRGLHHALQGILRDAIRARGTTLQDYRTALGTPGSYASDLRVYGREGRPCARRCGGTVERLVFSNRSSFFCPRCQPEPSSLN